MQYTEKLRSIDLVALIEQKKYKEAIDQIIEEVKYNYSFIQDKADEEIREVYELILIYGKEIKINSAVDEQLFAFIKFRRDLFIDLFYRTIRGLK